MDIFGTITDTGDFLIRTLKGMINPIVAASDGAKEKLKAAAIAWLKDYKTLQSIPDSELSPFLIKEKRGLLNRGGGIIEKIKAMGIGSDFITQQMGAAVLIPVAVITVGAALMLYWTLDYQKFKTNVAEYKALVKSGLSNQGAINALKEINNSGPGLLSNLSTVTKSVAVIGAVYVAYEVSKKYR